MRVFIVTKRAPFEGRGAEHIIWRIGQHLAAAGHRVRYFCPTPTTTAEAPDIGGIDFEFVDTVDDPTRSMMLFFVRGALEYRIAYQRFNPDVVYDNPSPVPFVPAHFYGKAPVVSKVHAIYRRLAFTCKDHPLIKLGTVAGEETYRLYKDEHFVTNSESTAERLRQLVDTDRNEVVANPIGIDASAFNFEYRPDSKTVLSLSKLSPRKRICDLLEAWVDIQNEHPNANLVIAGSGPNEQQLRRQAQCLSLKRVEFAGYVSEARKQELLQEAAIFVNPTLYEGFGIANLEAMASGCAVISTNTWGVRDYIDEKKNGLMIESKDTHALAENINQLLVDSKLRSNLAEGGRQTALKYNIFDSIERDIEILENEISK